MDANAISGSRAAAGPSVEPVVEASVGIAALKAQVEAQAAEIKKLEERAEALADELGCWREQFLRCVER